MGTVTVCGSNTVSVWSGHMRSTLQLHWQETSTDGESLSLVLKYEKDGVTRKVVVEVCVCGVHASSLFLAHYVILSSVFP